jgi:hypothetical protein
MNNSKPKVKLNGLKPVKMLPENSELGHHSQAHHNHHTSRPSQHSHEAHVLKDFRSRTHLQVDSKKDTLKSAPHSAINPVIKNYERKLLISDPELAKESEESKKVPGLLNKIFNFSKKSEANILNNLPKLDSQDSEYSPERKNLNSIGSIFSGDSENSYGIQRVFKKSVVLMVVDILAFIVFAFLSTKFFSIFLPLAVLSMLFAGILGILFFVILADRSYLFISLGVKALSLFAIYSLIGEGFSTITFLGVLTIILFIYLAYSELEKYQISSRLFSISHVAIESIRVLTTALILILTLGLFNSAISLGSEKFLKQSFLDNQLIMDNLIIGKGKISLNYFFMEGNFVYSDEDMVVRNGAKKATIRSFLTENYKSPEVLTELETKEIQNLCLANKQTQICSQKLNDAKDKKLEEWKKETYPELNEYKLDTIMTKDIFEVVSTAYYIKQIQDFENTEGDLSDAHDGKSKASSIAKTFADFQIMPIDTVIPGMIAVTVLVVLMLFKFVLHWLIMLGLMIIWGILKVSGFVRIDVENVEAEVVSI